MGVIGVGMILECKMDGWMNVMHVMWSRLVRSFFHFSLCLLSSPSPTHTNRLFFATTIIIITWTRVLRGRGGGRKEEEEEEEEEGKHSTTTAQQQRRERASLRDGGVGSSGALRVRRADCLGKAAALSLLRYFMSSASSGGVLWGWRFLFLLWFFSSLLTGEVGETGGRERFVL